MQKGGSEMPKHRSKEEKTDEGTFGSIDGERFEKHIPRNGRSLIPIVE
jgi:hypothetical protein